MPSTIEMINKIIKKLRFKVYVTWHCDRYVTFAKIQKDLNLTLQDIKELKNPNNLFNSNYFEGEAYYACFFWDDASIVLPHKRIIWFIEPACHYFYERSWLLLKWFFPSIDLTKVDDLIFAPEPLQLSFIQLIKWDILQVKKWIRSISSNKIG